MEDKTVICKQCEVEMEYDYISRSWVCPECESEVDEFDVDLYIEEQRTGMAKCEKCGEMFNEQEAINWFEKYFNGIYYDEAGGKYCANCAIDTMNAIIDAQE